MAKYCGWVIKKQYYKIELEANSWEEAKDMAWDVDVSNKKPDDYDMEIYDIEEVKNELT